MGEWTQGFQGPHKTNSHPKCGGAATQQVPHHLLLLFLNLLGKQAVIYSSPEGPNAPRKYKNEAQRTDPMLPSRIALSQSTKYLSSIQPGAYIFDRTWHVKLKRVTDTSVKPTTDAKKAAKPVI